MVVFIYTGARRRFLPDPAWTILGTDKWIKWRCGVIIIAQMNKLWRNLVERGVDNRTHRRCERGFDYVIDCYTLFDGVAARFEKSLGTLYYYRFEKPRHRRNKPQYTLEHLTYTLAIFVPEVYPEQRNIKTGATFGKHSLLKFDS